MYIHKQLKAKRGDNDVKLLKDTMKLANEMDAVFLEEMKQSLPLFNQIKSNCKPCGQRNLKIFSSIRCGN